MKVTLCDKNGYTQPGSDGHINVDGRFGIMRIRFAVQDYRERFKTHFKYKYDSWTHFKIGNSPRLYEIRPLVTN